MTGLKYVGVGAWIPGVPARDLTAEEAATYADLIEATAAAGHILYVQAVQETVSDVPANDAPAVKKRG